MQLLGIRAGKSGHFCRDFRQAATKILNPYCRPVCRAPVGYALETLDHFDHSPGLRRDTGLIGFRAAAILAACRHDQAQTYDFRNWSHHSLPLHMQGKASSLQG